MSRILVVDDDPNLREVIQGVLEVAGFEVKTAEDGQAALQRMEQERFDLLVLDVWMPRMNGLEVLERLRSAPRAPKVILLTADDTPGTVLRAVRQQAYQYMAKPFDPEALVDSVQRALEGPPAARPIEVVSAKPDWLELLIPCDVRVADRIQTFLQGLKADLPDDLRESVGAAFRELLLNAIEWGGELDPARKVRIAYLRTNRMLLYRIADPGKGFRFDDLNHAAVTYPHGQPTTHMHVRERKGLRPGGFGLLMTKAMADELLYNEAQNEVVLIKYLD